MTKDERTVYVFALRYALPRHSYALSIVSQMILSRLNDNAYKLDMPLGTAVKYILRAGKKNPAAEIEDLEKATECIRRAIELRRAKA